MCQSRIQPDYTNPNQTTDFGMSEFWLSTGYFWEDFTETFSKTFSYAAEGVRYLNHTFFLFGLI
jgi:hypothetical protein